MRTTYTILGLIGLLYAVVHIWWWSSASSPIWIMGVLVALASLRLMFSKDD